MGELESTPGGPDPLARRRRRWLVLIVALVVVVVGGLVALYMFRESSTPIGVDEAVSDFRAEETAAASAAPGGAETTAAETTAAETTVTGGRATATTGGATTAASTTTTATAPGSALPEAGVYTYETSGGESIDALGGRRHTYPAESTITIIHDDCGAVQQWRPLRERSEDTLLCPSAAGARLHWFRSHHRFFRIDDDRDFVCEPGDLFYPSVTEPGTTWTANCAAGAVRQVRTGRIVGTNQVDVGGTPVNVLTFTLHDDVSGASTGVSDQRIAVVPETGLIVEMSVEVDVQNDSPIGAVHYQESYELHLTALDPER